MAAADYPPTGRSQPRAEVNATAVIIIADAELPRPGDARDHARHVLALINSERSEAIIAYY